MGLFRNKKNRQRESEGLQRISTGEAEDKTKIRRFFGSLRNNFPWLLWGTVFSFICAVIFSSFYGIFHSNAAGQMTNIIENADNIGWLYRNCYLLYQDLYNAQNDPSLDYSQLYLSLDDEYQWIYERSEGDVYHEFDYQSETAELPYVGNNNVGMLTREEYSGIRSEINTFNNTFDTLGHSFRELNSNYDYLAVDTVTGREITNMSVEDKNRSLSQTYFQLVFEFDEKGNVTIGDKLRAQDEVLVRRLASEAAREQIISVSLLEKYGTINRPKNCRITFSISLEAWNRNQTGYHFTVWDYNNYGMMRVSYDSMYENAYRNSGMAEALLLCMAVMTLLGCFMPVHGNTKPWQKGGLCSLPMEILGATVILLCSLNNGILNMAVQALSGTIKGNLREALGISGRSAGMLALAFNLFVLMLYFFAWWYAGVSCRAVKELGIRGYIKERVLFYRIFPYIRSQAVKIYHSFTHLNLTENANKAIIKTLLVNAVILAGISFFWVGGIALILVYSLILYFILKKYISDLQDKYKVLLRATNEMAEGRLDVTINEDLGVFEPFKPQILKIQEGFQKAVEEEVKSQRMKAELITNVSHDLKTPLTAIITYVNLLKEENVTEEQRREYLDTLERKSLRLKALIEDLFEVSKANSKNITLNIVDVDIMNLLKQVEFEMQDKLDAAGLEMRMNLTDEKIILPLDSQKTFRIFENLFGNVAKYALTGTRVYVKGFCEDDRVFITLKNISAQEITVDSAELLERFVRGDASRNTEGSELSLAIAKSFTELQGGELSLEVDGDLFKVTVSWRIP